ncbi:MAG: transglycosylase SLT domain-containing protein, partial [Pseudobdellovibrionaceae bacterium]
NINHLSDKVVAYNPTAVSKETISSLKSLNPMIRLKPAITQERGALLRLITSRGADCVIMEQNEALSYGRYFGSLEIKVTLDKNVERGWLLRKNDDDLIHMAKYWQRAVSRSRELMAIRQRYMDHLDSIDTYEQREFYADLKNILPQYRAVFKKAAKDTGLPWELIAAVAYQESHWNPDARSFTGVKGIMQLTQATADHLGIKDRTDPEQSVRGGSLYLSTLLGRTPKHLHFKDRLSLALAAYNVGPGHLRDAQRLAAQRGLDPLSWNDLRTVLPLLSQKQYERQLAFGLARGDEPVKYVDRVRTYYDMIVVQM